MFVYICLYMCLIMCVYSLIINIYPPNLFIMLICLHNSVLRPYSNDNDASNILLVGHRVTFLYFSPIMLNYVTASLITQFVILQVVHT